MTTIKTESELIADALFFYGAKHQALQCIQEMAEFTKELTHYLQEDGRVDYDHIREELADVIVTCKQMETLFGSTRDWQLKKLARLASRMADGRGELE